MKSYLIILFSLTLISACTQKVSMLDIVGMEEGGKTVTIKPTRVAVCDMATSFLTSLVGPSKNQQCLFDDRASVADPFVEIPTGSEMTLHKLVEYNGTFNEYQFFYATLSANGNNYNVYVYYPPLYPMIDI